LYRNRTGETHRTEEVGGNRTVSGQSWPRTGQEKDRIRTNQGCMEQCQKSQHQDLIGAWAIRACTRAPEAKIRNRIETKAKERSNSIIKIR